MASLSPISTLAKGVATLKTQSKKTAEKGFLHTWKIKDFHPKAYKVISQHYLLAIDWSLQVWHHLMAVKSLSPKGDISKPCSWREQERELLTWQSCQLWSHPEDSPCKYHSGERCWLYQSSHLAVQWSNPRVESPLLPCLQWWCPAPVTEFLVKVKEAESFIILQKHAIKATGVMSQRSRF